jgi:hypothetical protein
MNSSPIKLKQKLSPVAKKAKAVRDLAAANSPYREAARASSQRAHRADPSKSGMDYDHKTSTFKSAKSNRGNSGKGTKVEGKSNYKIKN